LANPWPTSPRRPRPTVVIPLVFLVAGAGAWATYLFALFAIGLVALNINQFARRSSSPGNIYTYIALGLGPTAAIFVGWALFVGYVGIGSSVTTGFTNYVNVLIKTVFNLHSDLPNLVLAGIVGVSVFGAWLVAYKDVRLSARIMLTFELISVSLILVVLAVTLVHYGFRIDTDQLTLKGINLDGLRLGLVLAIFSFTGFESATSLGTEAKNPLRTIPHAVFRSALFVGFLFILASYASVVGFAGPRHDPCHHHRADPGPRELRRHRIPLDPDHHRRDHQLLRLHAGFGHRRRPRALPARPPWPLPLRLRRRAPVQ
jgi:amino acid transporter